MNVLQEWTWQLVGLTRTCAYKDYEKGIKACRRAGIDGMEGFVTGWEIGEGYIRGFDMSYVWDYQCTTGGKSKKMDMELHSDIR